MECKHENIDTAVNYPTQRAEHAEAQAAVMRKTLTDIAYATFRSEKSPESICAAICLNNLLDAAFTLLAEHKRYGEALTRLADYDNDWDYKAIDALRIARAALEKPPC